MGTISKGILGGFSGTVGTVIGGSWKGIAYMRSQPGKRSFTPSEKQLAQQARFALVMRFLQPMSALLEVTFRSFGVRMTGINSALSYNIQNAVTGTYPTLSIDYALALVSRGDLPNALSPAVTAGAGGILTFSWTDNSGSGIASSTDLAVAVAYCPALQQAVYDIGSSRGDMTADLNASVFAGQQVETWISFVTQDGKKSATSIFTGEVTVS
ncbi:hypothetical protein FW778_14365 [Ginsengibacter hankyongi]|uniref:Uncharacterized protein n=1 Tax=Ginsengibacter hankyongi TaxID=2607284 RepID=A0A5J5IHI1_9BACT|nr:DUF6266 family protein [Ginsengibacter hankyongi]KAA9038726.1 hypothetical protein FW778_14365 [Ginsengibacter hankyongi]